EASRGPRRLEPRPHRAGPRGARDVAARDGRPARRLPRSREEGARVNAVKRWAIAAGVLVIGRKRRRPPGAEPERPLEAGQPGPRAERLGPALLAGAAC